MSNVITYKLCLYVNAIGNYVTPVWMIKMYEKLMVIEMWFTYRKTFNNGLISKGR